MYKNFIKNVVCLCLVKGVFLFGVNENTPQTQNIYWDEIAPHLADKNSDLSKILEIDSVGALKALAAAEWMLHHGRTRTVRDVFSTEAMFSITAQLGKFAVLQRRDAPKLHAFVDELCGKLDIAKPLIIYAKNSMFNAFATGFSTGNSCMIIAQGMFEKSSSEALEGVIAHELGHIKHNHASKRIGLGGAQFLFAILTSVLLYANGAPKKFAFGSLYAQIIAMVLTQKLYSRYCERQADAVAIELVQKKFVDTARALCAHEDKYINQDTNSAREALQGERFEGLSEKSQANVHALLNFNQAKLNTDFNHLDPVRALFASHPTSVERLKEAEEVTN